MHAALSLRSGSLSAAGNLVRRLGALCCGRCVDQRLKRTPIKLAYRRPRQGADNDDSAGALVARQSLSGPFK